MSSPKSRAQRASSRKSRSRKPSRVLRVTDISCPQRAQRTSTSTRHRELTHQITQGSLSHSRMPTTETHTVIDESQRPSPASLPHQALNTNTQDGMTHETEQIQGYSCICVNGPRRLASIRQCGVAKATDELHHASKEKHDRREQRLSIVGLQLGHVGTQCRRRIT